MMRWIAAILSLAWISASNAQSASQQSGQSIADGATFGAVATLAPLCGFRDERWSDDLRQAARQEADDKSASPGQAVAALAYGDMEALEDFAADKPEATCSALRENPALKRADAAVDAFRRRRDGKPVG